MKGESANKTESTRENKPVLNKIYSAVAQWVERNTKFISENKPFFEKVRSFITSEIFLLTLIIAFAAVIRFGAIPSWDVWGDELWTMITSSSEYHKGYLFARNFYDVHPPLYYMFIRLWFSVFGFSTLSGMVFSVLLGLGSLLAFYSLCKESENKNVALVATLLLSLNWFHIRYSCEMRMYTMLFLLTAMVLKHFIRIFKTNQLKDYIAYTIFGSMIIYTHYYGFIVMLTTGILFIANMFMHSDSRKNPWNYLLPYGGSVFIIALSYSPWLVPFLSLNQKAGGMNWGGLVPPNFFVTFFSKFFNDNFMLLFIFALLLLVSILQFFLAKKKNEQKSTPLITAFLVLFAFLPYLQSLLSTPSIGLNHFVICLIPIFILAAHAIMSIPSKSIRVFIIIFVVSISLLDIYKINPFYQYRNDIGYRATACTDFIAEKNEKYRNKYNQVFVYTQAYYPRYLLHLLHSKNTNISLKTINAYVTHNEGWLLKGMKGKPMENTGFWLITLGTLGKEARDFTAYEKEMINTYFKKVEHKTYAKKYKGYLLGRKYQPRLYIIKDAEAYAKFNALE